MKSNISSNRHLKNWANGKSKSKSFFLQIKIRENQNYYFISGKSKPNNNKKTALLFGFLYFFEYPGNPNNKLARFKQYSSCIFKNWTQIIWWEKLEKNPNIRIAKSFSFHKLYIMLFRNPFLRRNLTPSLIPPTLINLDKNQ
jgi:hypothetical protein